MTDQQPTPKRKIAVEDRLEILDLLARYNWAVDTDDVDAFLDVFTSDGQFVTADKAYRGVAELREFIGLLKSRRVPDDQLPPGAAGRSAFHNAINVILEWDGDDIRLLAEFIGSRVADDGRVSMHFGWYDDRVTRVGGDWKFRRRHVRSWAEDRPSQSPVGSVGAEETARPPSGG